MNFVVFDRLCRIPSGFCLLGWCCFVLESDFAVRLSLRKNPVVRDRLFTLVLAGAFAHGFYLVYPFSFHSLLVAISRFQLLNVHDIDSL